MDDVVKIDFSGGTLLIEATEEQIGGIYNLLKYDNRVKKYRAMASNYAKIVLSLHRSGIPFEDRAKDFEPTDFKLKTVLTPHKHQKEAIEAWLEAGGRGLIVMPTGAGKTYTALMAIASKKRPALIVVPTIDLMNQWAGVLEKNFGQKVGMLGGGSKELQKLTVSTYDSAVIHMEFIGNRFGMVIFDECHHLPGPVNRNAAGMCLAPYRMGLSATPEREDDGERIIYELIGPEVYRSHIDELEGHILSPYETERIYLELDPDEEKQYSEARRIYTNFLKSQRIRFTHKNDWNKFIGLCARHPHGRKVFEAYLRQKKIARSGRSKFRKLWELIIKHKNERIIVFTAENDTAYELGRVFFLPVITHRTKAAERKDFLDRFRSGEYPVLLTSKVLNEGVDVPEASVGIIISGSGSIREHVQRLGRILRARDGKKAILYELISAGTSEMNVSKRRREHRAYQNPRKI